MLQVCKENQRSSLSFNMVALVQTFGEMSCSVKDAFRVPAMVSSASLTLIAGNMIAYWRGLAIKQGFRFEFAVWLLCTLRFKLYCILWYACNTKTFQDLEFIIIETAISAWMCVHCVHCYPLAVAVLYQRLCWCLSASLSISLAIFVSCSLSLSLTLMSLSLTLCHLALPSFPLFSFSLSLAHSPVCMGFSLHHPLFPSAILLLLFASLSVFSITRLFKSLDSDKRYELWLLERNASCSICCVWGQCSWPVQCSYVKRSSSLGGSYRCQVNFTQWRLFQCLFVKKAGLCWCFHVVHTY